METNFNFAQQGWQCPICKRVYSPFTPCCYYCGGESKTWIGTSTSGDAYPVDNPSSYTVTIPHEPNLDCWDNNPTLLTSYPPKLLWKCRYCGKEITTEITEKPTGICSCLGKNKSNETDK